MASSGDGRQGTEIESGSLPPIAHGRSGTVTKLKPAIKLKPMKLKLFVDLSRQKVIFAEAGKDVVDLLFSILVLPMSSLVQLLDKQSMVDCLGKLYHSLKSLDKSYIQSNQRTTDLLTPRVASLAIFSSVAARIWKVTCPGCSNKMETKIVYVPPPTSEKEGTSTRGTSAGIEEVGGFVKGLVKYIVMDDLEISEFYCICTLLKKLDVKDVCSLEEMAVELNMTKAREMLKVSLHSTTVLTDLFLSKKLKRCRVESV